MFAGNFAPVGWAFCNGQLLAISEYDTLFSLIGTTYGGDGVTTFALPDMRSRVPLHQGSGFIMGQTSGQEAVTLTNNQIPSHTHAALANATAASSADPTGNYWAASPALTQFSDQANNANLNNGCVQSTGGSQPHDNLHPYLAVNFIISLFGIYPSPN